ncbi:DMT family transporter [Desnuesiella massiliensis]|uniref:DMT family transporter n=1 Tax=Desnuesiella massiliensis TaxID=1650662 RepID=UPI0006E1F7FD|nr:DMT family transporter [Desnuesiella massiliensis]
MLGIIFSIVAGVAMSIQGVFNTRLGQKIGLWETNILVQGIGFVIALLLFFFLGDGNIKDIKSVNKFYLLGGVIGVLITYSVMKGIDLMGPTYSIATILVAQLTAAALIDAFALFDTNKIQFGLTKILGIVIMVLGIIIFKWKG